MQKLSREQNLPIVPSFFPSESYYHGTEAETGKSYTVLQVSPVCY